MQVEGLPPEPLRRIALYHDQAHALLVTMRLHITAFPQQRRRFKNKLARVSIPKDKEALIRLMMEKTEREKELKEAARAHWKPFAVMVNTDDYKLIEKAARKDNMTVEEWAEGILIRDAQERMEHVYPESLRVAEEPKGYGIPRTSGPDSAPNKPR